LFSVRMGNFSLAYQPNTTKMVKHKLVSFAAVVALWTLVTLLIKLIGILLKWPLCCKSEAILSEKFLLNYPVWSVHMGKFSSR